MSETLIIMGYIYNPDGFDWMNFKLTLDNPYTFHHIVERRSGGAKCVENGAILTDQAHKLLNMLDLRCPKAYEDLQKIFIKINHSNEPPTYEIMKEIDQILYNVFYTDKYVFRKETNLSFYQDIYEESRKELKKCLQ